MLFIGVDLSWPRRGLGVAVMEGDEFGLRLSSVRRLSTTEEVLSLVKGSARAGPVFVAIDAPLIVPARKGGRRAEGLVEVLFGQYAGGEERLSRRPGHAQGAKLASSLEGQGIVHDPSFKALERSRKCFEVYARPAAAVLFGLCRTLEHKAAPKRSLDERREALREYRQGLGRLKDVHLPRSLTRLRLEDLEGTALDEYGQSLDAVLCASIAYFAWRHPDRCEVLGNRREGYILTPVFQRRPKQVEDLFSKT